MHARRSLSIVATARIRAADAAVAHSATATRRFHMSAPASAPKADQKPAAMADGAAEETKGKKEKKKVRDSKGKQSSRLSGAVCQSGQPSQPLWQMVAREKPIRCVVEPMPPAPASASFDDPGIVFPARHVKTAASLTALLPSRRLRLSGLSLILFFCLLRVPTSLLMTRSLCS